MPSRTARNIALRVSGVYAAAGFGWILLTDTLVSGGRDSAVLQTAKGLLFVAATTAVLYATVLSWARRTERYAAELRQRERDYLSLFESHPLPMWVYDLETLRFLAVNRAAVAHYGYSEQEFLAMTIADIRPPADVPLLLDNVANVKTGLDRAGRWRHVLKDGRTITVEITSHTVEFEGRRAELVSAVDRTEEIEAREQLRRTSDRLRAIVDSSPIPVLVLDKDARVEMWSSAAQRVFGWTAEQVIGKPNPLVPAAANVDFEERWERVKAGDVLCGFEAVRQRADGSPVDVELYASPVFDANGQFEAAVTLVADITERKRVRAELDAYRVRLEDIVRLRTQELSRANERLAKATRIKDEFLANMSHELRTPLNAIIGFSGVMLQGLAGDLNDEQRKQLKMVRDSGNHLLALISDILDLSKIEAGRSVMHAEETDLVSIVDEVAVLLHAEADSKGINLSVTSAPVTLPAVTDAGKVRQIVLNLVSNAVKYTDHGHVDIVVEATAADALIRVEDTGPGIPADQLDEIFDEFTQAAHHAAAKPSGTGLGLAISRKLARMLGGEITVQSEVDRGSAFVVRVPLAVQGDMKKKPGTTTTQECT